MRKLLLTTLGAAALLAGCGDKTSGEIKIDKEETASSTETPSSTAEKPAAEKPGRYVLAAQYKKFAPVDMSVDTSFLSTSERAVVNKLMEINKPINAIFLSQLDTRNSDFRKEIAGSDLENKRMLLKMFDLHFGICDPLADGKPFYGDKPCPKGGGFYPHDMTKEEFDGWLEKHPEDAEAFNSGFTVIRRKGKRLVAVPYSRAYKPQLNRMAAIMREAAELSQEPTLKRYLNSRADAFMTDDYFQSDMDWMDLEGNIEVVIGPYEVYDDQINGYKTAFEMFLTVKNPEESAALAKYKNYLNDMERNLPVEDSYKNFGRGSESPLVVAYQVKGGGDNANGIQTIAFNLPNDERVREAKGSKKVILNNVLYTKFDTVLSPISEMVLVPEQAKLTSRKYMANNTLFHELSHGLGPGKIMKDGKETTVSAELRDLYNGLEEGKADIMGIYNILYMMEKGELPASEKNEMLATHFTGIFRSVRFGTESAHAKGRTIQYNYYRKTGAVEWDASQKRFKIDYVKMEQAVSDLTGMFIRVQGDGDYDKAKAFLGEYGHLDDQARAILSNLNKIPVDIRPIYPKGI